MQVVHQTEYVWAIFLLFVMERICYLQEQFDIDFSSLPEAQDSNIFFNNNIEDFYNRDSELKSSFLRLCRLMHGTMLLALVYFCNISVWYLTNKKSLPRFVKRP